MMQEGLKYKSVRDFYKNKNIFITGSTGFLGKILLEKLLRSCPEVGTLYLLLRPKRGQNPELRIKELIKCPVFDHIHATNPDIFKKLRVVCGDVSEDRLAIKNNDWQEIIKNVEIVFHCAACVRFDMTLKYAITYNTMGTKRVLTACEEIENLESMIYVSTTYCHCDQEILEERVYEPKYNPYNVLDLVSWMDEQLLTTVTPSLVGNQPNTYAFSKCLSEKLVAEASSKYPVAIARPSIVTSVFQEPIPGWVDNLNGPTGLMVGAGKGVLRSMHCKPDYHADFIPVDICCNGIILLAWHLANNWNPKETLVANLCADATHNRLSWGACIDLGRKYIYDLPFGGAVWYPDGSIKGSKIAHEICVILFHQVPAYLIDGLAVLFRQKPFMVNIQRRLQGGLELLQYYTTKEWHFKSDRIFKISKQLCEKEQGIFNIDTTEIDHDEYMKNMILGTRKFILKQDSNTIPKARRHMRRLYWLDRVVRVIFYLAMFWLLYSCYDVSSTYVFQSYKMITDKVL